MNDTILQDSVAIVATTLEKISQTESSVNIWLWLSVIEFFIILFILIKIKNKKQKDIFKELKKESLIQEVDFDNIIISSFNSTALYNELKVKCHPDKFATDEEKTIIAENIFQEISKNKTNMKKLLELKEEAKMKLNVNFKN
jgi:hypothetical protein